MGFDTGFRGNIGGSVQSNYTDQPGVGVPGMLAFASDINFADAVFIGEEDGIAAGRGVIFDDNDPSTSLQRPDVSANLPSSTTVFTDFKGIIVFDEQMQSDANGVPGWANSRVGRVLRNNRAGGRIYVIARILINHTIHNVHLQIVADGGVAVGEFSPALVAGKSILIPNAKWITSAVVGDVAMIELLG